MESHSLLHNFTCTNRSLLGINYSGARNNKKKNIDLFYTLYDFGRIIIRAVGSCTHHQCETPPIGVYILTSYYQIRLTPILVYKKASTTPNCRCSSKIIPKQSSPSKKKIIMHTSPIIMSSDLLVSPIIRQRGIDTCQFLI